MPRNAIPGPSAIDPQQQLNSLDDSTKAAEARISEDIAEPDTVMKSSTRPVRSRISKTRAKATREFHQILKICTALREGSVFGCFDLAL